MDFRWLEKNELRRECDISLFDFKSTASVEPNRDIIGQQRAVDAMNFGLTIKMEGYNIYMSGSSGEGKTSYALGCTQKIAENMPIPNDWCYVYNFNNPSQPIAISLPSGKGKIFKKDMEEFVKIIAQEIDKAFNGEDYEAERTKIIARFRDVKDKLVKQLNKESMLQGFKVTTTGTGIYFLPIWEGKTLSEEEYKNLDEEVKSKINKNSEQLQEQTFEIIKKIRGIELEAEEAIDVWENRIALFAVGYHIDNLKMKYSDYQEIIDYLKEVQADILDNLDSLRVSDSGEEHNVLMPMMKKQEDTLECYRVNLLVDNSSLKGAPVIVDYNPTYYNIMGRLEYENELGNMTTNYTMIKPGLFHQANGGFIVVQIKDILNNPQAWEAVKRTIKTRQITIENIKEQMGLAVFTTIKPQPIPIDVKVILVGSSHFYQLLYKYDRDFRKLFKIKADFDDSMEWNEENIKKLTGFISAFCKREGVPHFSPSGVAQVINYCSRLVEDQTKLTTSFTEVVDILSEASTWASIDGKDIVDRKHVKKATIEKSYRSRKYDHDLLELLKEGTIMIDTEGEVVGQINGLSILDVGDYSFGKPSRITATTYMGKTGIVNIEREVQMSGVTHAKGVMILSGYIGQKYAREMPLSLTASICFEQLYSGVDGDSASSAELYAIMSSLSGLPLKQGIAVTGSVNQRGEIQPIGGVTAKIEGFFELCKLRGLTGRQGVIIPHQNIKNLVLNDDVVKAVEQGKFKIYPIKNVDEGIEILTGVLAGSKNGKGAYPEGTVHDYVNKKLKYFAETVKKFCVTN